MPTQSLQQKARNSKAVRSYDEKAVLLVQMKQFRLILLPQTNEGPMTPVLILQGTGWRIVIRRYLAMKVVGLVGVSSCVKPLLQFLLSRQLG